MRKKYKIGFWLAVLGVVLSGVVVFWGNWLPPQQEVRFDLKPLILPDGVVSGLTAQGVLVMDGAVLVIPQEMNRVDLLYRDSIRLGDTELFQFKLGNGQQVATGVEVITLTDIIPYYNLMVEASLEIPGVMVTPPGSIIQALLPGQGLGFTWKMTPGQRGQLAGRMWLYLLFVPKDGSAVERVAVLARPVELRSLSFFGLPGEAAQWGGGIAFFLFLCLGFWMAKKR